MSALCGDGRVSAMECGEKSSMRCTRYISRASPHNLLVIKFPVILIRVWTLNDERTVTVACVLEFLVRLACFWHSAIHALIIYASGDIYKPLLN